jgi:hypothetical protein
MKLNDLTIRSFRCHISAEIPGIGAANAIDVKKKNCTAELTTLGVLLHVPIKVGAQMVKQPTLIPFTNIQAVFFDAPDEATVTTTTETKRSPGRPRMVQETL